MTNQDEQLLDLQGIIETIKKERKDNGFLAATFLGLSLVLFVPVATLIR